ncbi:MAG TPA: hypothetical protein VFE65_27680 [Pseudonocardia sp.]|jgi:uncharacterized membrane protein|nr:hypothetical protein [Pseudonocardia sp.]
MTMPSGGDAGDSAPAVSDAAASQAQRLSLIREELHRLEKAICGGHEPFSAAAQTAAHARVPAWLRVSAGESRWTVVVAIVAAIALQVALPDRLTMINRWVLPGLELTLLIALVIANPGRLDNESRALRTASLALSGVLSVANAWSAVLLTNGLVSGKEGADAGQLLSTGAAIWLTNIIAFGLWYWQFDRGGPASRAHARKTRLDFQFPQMQDPGQHHEWEPTFVDYLYLSFTNATAFSPTDVMPFSRWAKLTMLVQALVSLVTVALVIARAVNILR